MDRTSLRCKTFMEHAKLCATLSTCSKLSVGCVLVKDKHIIATGYNGVISGCEHCKDVSTEDHYEFQQANEIHAEMNSLIDALDRGVVVRGSVCYVTHSPCAQCMKHLARAGIVTVVYDKLYSRSSIRELKSFELKFNVTVISLQEALDMYDE